MDLHCSKVSYVVCTVQFEVCIVSMHQVHGIHTDKVSVKQHFQPWGRYSRSGHLKFKWSHLKCLMVKKRLLLIILTNKCCIQRTVTTHFCCKSNTCMGSPEMWDAKMESQTKNVWEPLVENKAFLSSLLAFWLLCWASIPVLVLCWASYLDPLRHSCAVHSAGHVHRVSPDVVLGFPRPYYASHHRAHVQTCQEYTYSHTHSVYGACIGINLDQQIHQLFTFVPNIWPDFETVRSLPLEYVNMRVK